MTWGGGITYSDGISERTKPSGETRHEFECDNENQQKIGLTHVKLSWQ